MRFHQIHARLAALTAAFVLAASTAHAFTVENKDAADPYGVPKFDLEEQAKNFRKGGSDTSSTGKSEYDTPIGTLQFGVHQGPSSNFGWAFGPGGLGFGPSVRNSRQDMDRMLAPPSSLEFNGAR